MIMIIMMQGVVPHEAGAAPVAGGEDVGEEARPDRTTTYLMLEYV